MGNSSKKLAANCTLLTKDEQKYFASTFRNISRSSSKIREDDISVSGTVDPELLDKYWGPQIDPRLAQYLCNYLFGSGANRKESCDFNRFAELYVYNVRGDAEEKLKLLYECLGMEFSRSNSVPYQLLREYCESIVSTYIRMVKSSNDPNPCKWISKGFSGKASYVQSLGEAVAATVHADPDEPASVCSAEMIQKWLYTNTLLRGMTEMVFNNLYGLSEARGSSTDLSIPVASRSLFPHPDGIDPLPDYPDFIDLSHIVWLNQQLPAKHQHKWRFLFSSHVHGESFSTMAGRIQDVGPTVIIIQDSAGHIFGGFGSVAWMLKPTFYGDDNCFLFSLAPKMRVYPATTYNDHYQYMNYQTKTLPNGLLMGGQFEFGGIWIPADPFGQGACAESCSTYRGYKRLSKEKDFKIRSLEVWGVGDKPVSLKESEERGPSVLDRDPETKAIMELVGRTRHSEGLREPTDS